MPSQYSQCWKRFFIFNKPTPAKEIFENNDIKVYLYLTHKIIDEKKFKDIINDEVETTRWEESPSQTGHLSWENFEEDIKRILLKK